jgi:hypothetical protein
MKAGFLALPLAAIAALIAAPAFAQIMQKPVYPRVGPLGFANVPMRSFESYRDFYASIAAERHFADPESDFTIQQIQSRASLDPLRDYDGDPIVVVKLDQPDAPGKYSFYVIREVENRLHLLGQMNGYGYETTTSSGHLEFTLDVRGRATSPRYQVDGQFLINLADLAELDRNDPVPLDIKNGF